MSRLPLCEYDMASPVNAWTVSCGSWIDTLLSVPLWRCVSVVAPHICVIVSVLFWACLLVSHHFQLCVLAGCMITGRKE